jgi:inorganic pyrophosphatase
MLYSAISIGDNPPDEINVIIEVSVGSQPIKYEMNKEAGTLFVDRFLYTPMSYPGNYGFVPHTLAEDGDPIDVLICNTRPLMPGCVISARPIGALMMEDDAGIDEKIIAVPSPRLTKRYDGIEHFTDLPAITLQQVQHFFEHYKDLEPGKWVKIGDWMDADTAGKMIMDAVDRAKSEPGG